MTLTAKLAALPTKRRAAIARRARELAEDRADLQAARKALQQPVRWIPLEEVKQRLGLKRRAASRHA